MKSIQEKITLKDKKDVAKYLNTIINNLLNVPSRGNMFVYKGFVYKISIK